VAGERTDARTPEERSSPLVGQVALLVAFAAIVLAGVFTVLVPELRDDTGEGEAAEESAEPTGATESTEPPE
jgi:hypothetical protein